MRRHFQRRQVKVKKIDDIWGADLVEMQEWSKQNKGFRYMLNIIDVFSKFAWSVPIKNKTGVVVLDAFKEVIKHSNRSPKYIWVDEGKEFYNKDMTAWLKENNIERYSTHGEHKSAIVERFNRTLKEKMWKRFTAVNTRNWINMLDSLMNEYNNTKHTTIKMTPIEGSMKENEAGIFEIINKASKIKNIQKFKLGDTVRISRIKGIFEKGYLPNWSEEIYKVIEVKNTIPYTYIIEDTSGERIVGSFYNEELQKTKQKVFRIEKVLRKKKINGEEFGLVKWLGYNKKFNEWIPIKNLEKL